MGSSALKIKICGNTNYDDAALSAELGAWGLGFIFVDGTPRACQPSQVKAICERLDDGVEKVGVFLNEELETVNRIVADVGLTWVQCHGDESPEYCNNIDANVLKAVQNLELSDIALLDKYECTFLLDAKRVGDNWGGTGHTSDWELAARIARDYPLFLAGNLGAENVVEAIEATQPLGIDLSSSVEDAPGTKDHGKLRRLFQVLNDSGYAV